MAERTFYAEGPRSAPVWREFESDYAALAASYRRLRYGLWPLCGIALLMAPFFAEGLLGWLVMGLCYFVPYFMSVAAWFDCTARAENCDRSSRECADVAADLELGLLPSRWSGPVLSVEEEVANG